MNPELLRQLMQMQAQHQQMSAPASNSLAPMAQQVPSELGMMGKMQGMGGLPPQMQQATPMGEHMPMGGGGQPDPAALMRALLGPGAGMGGGLGSPVSPGVTGGLGG